MMFWTELRRSLADHRKASFERTPDDALSPEFCRIDARDRAVCAALSLLLLALWSLTHRYQGLSGDAGLYAVQALAHIDANLADDLFLQGTSQDSYTVFSPLYAGCIELFGLHGAALVLALLFKIWFFAAAWALARRLMSAYAAFLSVILLIVIEGTYGAFGVFRYAEDWLTARSLAEALVVTAIASCLGGRRVLAIALAFAAMFIHPLMALPGLLLLLCLRVSPRFCAYAAAIGVLIACGAALAAGLRPVAFQLFAVMDPAWLEVVRERSQFLFLQLWSASDWHRNARPFLSLALTAIVIDDPRIRQLCICAAIVGAAGLALALIAGLAPIALLLQGQAWRWVWISTFVAVLMLPPTCLAVSRERVWGPCCAVLVIAAWLGAASMSLACLAGAAMPWLLRVRIARVCGDHARWAVGVSCALLSAWAVKEGSPWTSSTMQTAWHGGSALLGVLRRIPDVPGAAAALAFMSAFAIRACRSSLLLGALACAALLTVCIFTLPAALRLDAVDGTQPQVARFADWRSAIPPTANVFVESAHNSPAFAWFTLQRPSYLTVDQSSGVVFSRATALEVRRRSQVLLPLMEPDWRLLSGRHKAPSGGGTSTTVERPLDRQSLIGVCRDPELGFVVAKEDLGFEPVRHTLPGSRSGWNLYDCRRVRSRERPG